MNQVRQDVANFKEVNYLSEFKIQYTVIKIKKKGILKRGYKKLGIRSEISLFYSKNYTNDLNSIIDITYEGIKNAKL